MSGQTQIVSYAIFWQMNPQSREPEWCLSLLISRFLTLQVTLSQATLESEFGLNESNHQKPPFFDDLSRTPLLL